MRVETFLSKISHLPSFFFLKNRLEDLEATRKTFSIYYSRSNLIVLLLNSSELEMMS